MTLAVAICAVMEVHVLELTESCSSCTQHVGTQGTVGKRTSVDSLQPTGAVKAAIHAHSQAERYKNAFLSVVVEESKSFAGESKI